VPNWKDVLAEVEQQRLGHAQAQRGVLDNVRRGYLAVLHQKTGRNVIAYYSGWLSKPGSQLDVEITDEDKNGFMGAVHNLDRTKGLDLFLHTPGGGLHPTQSIVDYLRKMFKNDIRAVVPQIAMSAGTIMACCCRSIMMAKHSNLGPIDPWLRGVPAAGVVTEFKRAYAEMKLDAAKARVWQPILAQYKPTFLNQCENAVKWAKTFVRDELVSCMLANDPKAKLKASRIVSKLSDFTGNRSHSRHIHMDECAAIGLTIESIEADPELQDLILTVHHCYMHSLSNSPSYKMIENHLGAAWVKQAVLTQ
jgi:ATP-dependent protease ClpP protease subunit